MVKASAINVREFARFILSVVTAITISFALSKFFAFRSRAWNRAVSEAARFLIIYAMGCAMYWMVAVFILSECSFSRMAWQSKLQSQGAFWWGPERWR